MRTLAAESFKASIRAGTAATASGPNHAQGQGGFATNYFIRILAGSRSDQEWRPRRSCPSAWAAKMRTFGSLSCKVSINTGTDEPASGPISPSASAGQDANPFLGIVKRLDQGRDTAAGSTTHLAPGRGWPESARFVGVFQDRGRAGTTAGITWADSFPEHRPRDTDALLRILEGIDEGGTTSAA